MNSSLAVSSSDGGPPAIVVVMCLAADLAGFVQGRVPATWTLRVPTQAAASQRQ